MDHYNNLYLSKQNDV